MMYVSYVQNYERWLLAAMYSYEQQPKASGSSSHIEAP